MQNNELEYQKDQTDVHAVSIIAVLGVLEEFLYNNGQDGLAYVVGNKHYNKLELGAWHGVMSTIDDPPRFPSNRRQFLQDKAKCPECKGFIPVTIEALDDMVDMGMKVIAQGEPIPNPYTPGTENILVYR